MEILQAVTDLDRGFAKEIIALVDEIHGGGTKYQATSEHQWKQLHDLTDGQGLRRELQAFLERNKLPTYVTTKDDWWRLFFSYYARVISDAPVKVKGTGKFVKQLVVKTQKAERRVGNDQTSLKPFREAFKLTWVMTKMDDKEEMIMSVEFPEDWFGPIPEYVPAVQ